MNQEMKKQQAIKYLERLNIYPPYIDGFKEENKVCFFERFGGYWAEQEPEIQAKIHEIENKYKCLVYAVTHEFTDFGECWDFLIVTDYKCEWRTLLMPTRIFTLFPLRLLNIFTLQRGQFIKTAPSSR